MGVVASAERSPDRSVDRSGGRSTGAELRRERPSFDRFYESQYATVTRLAYSLCGSLAVAEELAQEAFVAAHSRWRRISLFDRPDLWVRRVVINRSLSYRRRLASERSALERVSQAPASSHEPVLVDDEVWQALRSLSDRQTEVLALVYVEDRPIAEVAEILRLGEETIRTHLKRGRAALATRLGERTYRDNGR
jgi:RNA polymerase sigma-70 factor (ECF subfamily)